MSPTTLQNSALIQEVSISIHLIHAGLGQLQLIGRGNDHYHLPFLSLASGLERLMKTILCLKHLHTKGEFPSDKIWWAKGSKGHDLEKLLNDVRD